jgi:oligopeptide/dipeptide ABC transporter ATP-binding protein
LSGTLVEVKGLTKFFTRGGGLLGGKKQTVRALEGVNLSVHHGQTVGLVGESGCGKSTLGRCLLRLIEPTSGEVIFEGANLLKLNPQEMQQRRCDIQMLYQNPYSSLNPRLTVHDIVAEPIVTHTQLRHSQLTEQVEELLSLVDMKSSDMHRYPHEFSGGQLQRIALARTLALHPKFVVLDEPTSALDVSVQANILNLLLKLQRELNLTYLFISHDLSVVQHVSDWIAVMYLGRIVERGKTEDIFSNALHPYTRALLSSIPAVDINSSRKRIVLEGNIPSPANPPPGCKFFPRCRARIEHGLDKCDQEEPELITIRPDHDVRCWLYPTESIERR